MFNEARKLINTNAHIYIERLAEAVAIRSVSTDLSCRDDCFAMADLLHRWIEELGGSSDKVLVGFQELDDGSRYDLPPVILAEFSAGKPRQKPTVLVYGHYDVQPAAEADGWSTDPFTLSEVDGKLYGRGSTDDKGPILAWLWAIEIHRELELELPVNVKFCLEGMEESNSECLDDLLERESKGGFLSNVDYVVITDNYWVTTDKPCLTYGLRGLATFHCEVKAGTQTLHSGVYGGCIAEPMTDVIQLLAAVSEYGHGDIGIENCGRKSATPITEAETELYKGITFDAEAFRHEAGDVPALLGENEKEVLMNRWRYPSLSIHGIEGGYSGEGFKTVIPGAATGKFSIRLVPGQDGKAVEESVKAVLEKRFAELKSANKMTVTSTSSKAWLADPRCPLYQSGAAALLKVYGVKPDLTREGGSIPVAGLLQEKLGVETMLLPLGQSDDGAHSENEKMSKRNYLQGVQVLFTFLGEIARAHEERGDMPNGTPKRKGTLGRLKDIWYGLS
ncbi:unnamed protein product [Chondrus crispus]|uniref:Peptidase M20 dimerisation domain-containing protein n=1 Tax=Chondrus crispus TaxID=2769 RepID=R7QAU1_CHOCR|nr:unnamed protein product [Chondrus crispus]CDF34511.1 unnamed protein product [Chondrus crispus]|eukprot:XP_005714330.1 unnamed protein product [Chondrus crispus]